jgi:threonine dehydrogenase-like Zn-dependent dehydrogenase
MRALTVRPGESGSAQVQDVRDAEPTGTQLLVRTLSVGLCGTDRDILAGRYGAAPPGEPYLILGHESLGEVLAAPDGSGFVPGDLAVAIVRHPDPVPCPNCAVGEWDMCRNGLYTEHGIKELHGFCSERFSIEPQFAVKLPPELAQVGMLVEPASILAKAWEHIERIGARAYWEPKRVLVTGAGPIGLLAALMGAQRGLEVHVLDRVTSGPKPELVRALGAHYHTGDIQSACAEANVLIECTGVAQLVFDAMQCTAPGGIVCLTGLSSGARELTVDFAALNQSLVLENDVIFGSVNANRRHYQAAVNALAKAEMQWLERLISRRVRMQEWSSAFKRQAEDVKTVIQVNE